MPARINRISHRTSPLILIDHQRRQTLWPDSPRHSLHLLRVQAWHPSSYHLLPCRHNPIQGCQRDTGLITGCVLLSLDALLVCLRYRCVLHHHPLCGWHESDLHWHAHHFLRCSVDGSQMLSSHMLCLLHHVSGVWLPSTRGTRKSMKIGSSASATSSAPSECYECDQQPSLVQFQSSS